MPLLSILLMSCWYAVDNVFASQKGMVLVDEEKNHCNESVAIGESGEKADKSGMTNVSVLDAR